MAEPVLIGAPHTTADLLAELAREAGRAARADDVVGQALDVARARGSDLPRAGQGETAALWSALATLGAVDLTVARVIEPHLDALTILAEASVRGPQVHEGAVWGVYAAESPTQRLTAVASAPGWVLQGEKPWCSLADRVSHALVTAWVDDRSRGLFAVDLREPGVRPDAVAGTWVSHGLPHITSNGVRFAGVVGVPVGEPGWYLQRPGFAWGGVGVAAIWFGAAVAVARRVVEHVNARSADQIAHLQVGQLDLALSAGRAVLESAAGAADGAPGPRLPSEVVAVRARSTVAQTVDTVIRVADHAMGPGPLAQDAEHAQRISDLRLYVRQHHAERDVADLGRRVLEAPGPGAPW